MATGDRPAVLARMQIQRPPRVTLARREAAWGLVFLSPWIVGVLLFTALPMVASLAISLTDFDLRHPEAIRFVGLANYQRMLSDPNVLQSLGVTVKFALISVPTTMAAALAVALLTNQALLRGKPIFRALFYMPYQIPLVASTLIWAGVLNMQTGWLNLALSVFGIDGPNWINDTFWIYPGLTLMGLWGIGNMMVIFLAGLQGVPTELYEAARVDGAGRLQSFRHITLPMISPVIFYNLIIALIGTFQYFTQAYTLTNGRGDPDNATLFFNLNLYREAFKFMQMGYGAALAWVLFVIVLGLTILLFGSSARWVYYAGGER